jgi:hypothetical protein
VADDSLHPRRLCRCVWCCDGSAEKLDDRCPTADRVAAAQLEFAVLAKGLSKVVESQGVTRPVVAGKRVTGYARARPAPKAP